MYNISVFSNGDMNISRKNEKGKLFFVKWDQQMSPLPDRFIKLDHDPQTVNSYYMRSIPVTKAMENYLRGILNLFCPNLTVSQFEKYWFSLWKDGRAFSDFTGIETDNFQIHEIVTAGATFEAVTGNIVRMGKGNWMEFYAVNINRLPSVPSRAEDVNMLRHFRPTTFTHEKLPDGTYRVGAFPQFKEKTVLPMFSRTDTLFLPAERLIPVTSIQNPFNPPFNP